MRSAKNRFHADSSAEVLPNDGDAAIRHSPQERSQTTARATQRPRTSPTRRGLSGRRKAREGFALRRGSVAHTSPKKPEVTAMSPLPARETSCVSLSPATARTAACPGCGSSRGSAQGAAVPPPPFGLLCRRVFLTFLLPISWDIGTGHAWKTRLAVRGLRLSRPAKNAGRSQTQPRQNSPSARAKIGAA